MKNRLIPSLIFMILLSSGCSDKTTAPPEPTDDHVIRVPAEQTTIQAAIDAAADGDTVLVASGVYTGDGNRDISLLGKQVILRSESGPHTTILQCGGSADEPHQGIAVISGEDSVVIDGFTITGAWSNNGAAIRCKSTSPTIRNCVLAGNNATVSGGALHLKSSSPLMTNCTITGNSSVVGAGMLLIAGASPILENCIISYSTAGEAVYSVDGTSIPFLSCCLVFGNAGGDWTGHISDQQGVRGNLSVSPRYCDTVAADFHLQISSPCLPEANDCEILIGALGGGCQ